MSEPKAIESAERRRWLHDLIARHVADGLGGDGETARKCREFAIAKLLEDLGEEKKTGSGLDLTRLTESTKRKVIEELGGPDTRDEKTAE